MSEQLGGTASKVYFKVTLKAACLVDYFLKTQHKDEQRLGIILSGCYELVHVFALHCEILFVLCTKSDVC